MAQPMGVLAMLAASPMDHAEECAIHDYEGLYTVRISEWAGFARVADLAAFIDEHSELGRQYWLPSTMI